MKKYINHTVYFNFIFLLLAIKCDYLIASSEPNYDKTCKHYTTTFDKPSSLQRHTRINTGEKPFSCTICGYEAAEKGNVKRHIKEMHYKIRPHLCFFCGKTFKRRSRVIEHACKPNPKQKREPITEISAELEAEIDNLIYYRTPNISMCDIEECNLCNKLRLQLPETGNNNQLTEDEIFSSMTLE